MGVDDGNRCFAIAIPVRRFAVCGISIGCGSVECNDRQLKAIFSFWRYE
jgi:hypothetical protein